MPVCVYYSTRLRAMPSSPKGRISTSVHRKDRMVDDNEGDGEIKLYQNTDVTLVSHVDRIFMYASNSCFRQVKPAVSSLMNWKQSSQ